MCFEIARSELFKGLWRRGGNRGKFTKVKVPSSHNVDNTNCDPYDPYDLFGIRDDVYTRMRKTQSYLPNQSHKLYKKLAASYGINLREWKKVDKEEVNPRKRKRVDKEEGMDKSDEERSMDIESDGE